MKKIFLIVALIAFTITGFSQKGIPLKKNYNEMLNDAYCTGIFNTADGTYFDVLDSKTTLGYLNILEWLQGRVAGLQLITSTTGTPLPYIRNQRATIYIDEIRRDAESLSSLAVTDIAMIKVIKQPFIGNFGNTAGTIAIYTVLVEDEE